MKEQFALREGEFTFIKDGQPDPKPVAEMEPLDDDLTGVYRVYMITETTRPWKAFFGYLERGDGLPIEFMDEPEMVGALAGEYTLDIIPVQVGSKFRYKIVIDDNDFETHETEGIVPTLAFIADFGEKLKVRFEVEKLEAA